MAFSVHLALATIPHAARQREVSSELESLCGLHGEPMPTSVSTVHLPRTRFTSGSLVSLGPAKPEVGR